MGHRNNTVASLACGHVATATRASQHSRHNKHSDCSPSGSNYPYISKECWPLCEPRFSLLRVLLSDQWGRPPTFSTQTCRGTDAEGEDPLIQRKLSKTSGPTVLYSVLHPNSKGQGAQTAAWDWPCCKPKGGVEERRPPVLVPQTCAGLVSERIPVPPCSSLRSVAGIGSVLVPIVLVMMLTGPPTSTHLIPPMVCHTRD